MRIVLYIAGFAALLALMGCAHQPPQGGASSQGIEGYSQNEGHGSSGTEDYQELLSDPGWF